MSRVWDILFVLVLFALLAVGVFYLRMRRAFGLL